MTDIKSVTSLDQVPSSTGGDTITSPGGTITVGGTSTNTTLDIAKGPVSVVRSNQLGSAWTLNNATPSSSGIGCVITAAMRALTGAGKFLVITGFANFVNLSVTTPLVIFQVYTSIIGIPAQNAAIGGGDIALSPVFTGGNASSGVGDGQVVSIGPIWVIPAANTNAIYVVASDNQSNRIDAIQLLCMATVDT